MFCLLDLVGENDRFFVGACTKDEVLNSESWSEGRDVSLRSCHEHSLRSPFEGEFDGIQEELFPNQLSQDKQVT